MIENEDYDDVNFAQIFGTTMGILDNELILNQNRFKTPSSKITSRAIGYSDSSIKSEYINDTVVEFSSNTSSDSSEPGNYHNMFLNIADSNYKISYQGCRDDFCDQKEL